MHNPPSVFRPSFPTHVTQTRMFTIKHYTYITSFRYLRLLQGDLLAKIRNSIVLYVNQLSYKIKSMLLWTVNLTSDIARCVSTYVKPHISGFSWTVKSSWAQYRGTSHLQQCQADNPTRIRKPKWTINNRIRCRSRSSWPCGLQPIVWWGCGFESRQGHGCPSLVGVVCCQVAVSSTGRSLVQRWPTGPGCDLNTSTMKRPRSVMGRCTTKKKHLNKGLDIYIL